MSDTRAEAAIEEARRFLEIAYMPKRKRFVDPHDLASQVAANSLERGELPPDWATRLVITRLRRDVARRTPRKPGRDPLANAARDFYIAIAVGSACEQRGFDPTRNRSTRDKGSSESACSIVAAALLRLGVQISEDAVEKIWLRDGPRLAI